MRGRNPWPLLLVFAMTCWALIMWGIWTVLHV